MRRALIIGLLLASSPAAAGHRHHQAGRPSAWCGWYMTKITGHHDRKLWIARNWAHIGRASRAKPGVAVVWPHHVGKVLAVQAGRILVLSGNDGNAVRKRWRSTRGVIAFREL